jgi:hypothetical protein
MRLVNISQWTKLIILGGVLCVFATSAPFAAQAKETPNELTWEDLVPEMPNFDDPYAKLTPDQLSDLSSVAVMRGLVKRDSSIMTAEKRERLGELEKSLAESGIDVDDILAQRERVTAERRQRAETVVDELDGTRVRIPGYVLPLAFEGTQVTEFLLVPYVGACIHTPPPPPNQIVHVTPEESFETKGLYEPVWVTGEMSAVPTQQSLYLVDGNSDISVGYGLNAIRIEPYE